MNTEKIIKDNERMIWKMTNYFYGIDKNDLFQAGVVGLLKALKKYHTDSDVKFSSFAYNYIFGEMYTLACNKNIKISKDILNLYKKIESMRYTLAQKMNRIPTNLELSEVIGVSLEDIELACSSASQILSLDMENDSEKDMYESISSYDEDIDTKILINDSLEVLDDSEKDIIKSRYFEDLTQSEVARKLNMTQVMVSRYEKKGMNKLREFMTN